jgi:hypothetical protein
MCAEKAYTELKAALDNSNGDVRPWDHNHDGVLQMPSNPLVSDTPLVWAVDLDRNIVFYDRDGQSLMYDFLVPESGPLQLRHFRPYAPTVLSHYSCKQSSMICSPAAAPRDVVPEQLYRLVYRMATDYEHSWRMFGLAIESHGLNHFAMGILSCFTLNFEVRKVIGLNLHLHPFVNSVSASNFIRWRTWPSPQVVTTVNFGSTQVMFTEQMDLAASLVHEHFAIIILHDLEPYRFETTRRTDTGVVVDVVHDYTPFHVKVHYVVTSLREIQYFTKTHAIHGTTMIRTPVQLFFKFAGPPSVAGVRLLLNAIHQGTYPLHSPIHDLPIEIQELILDYACPQKTHNMFERAVFAAKLDIGVPFSFISKNHPVVLCSLERDRKLYPEEPEYHVFFGDTYAGLVYRVDKGSNMKESNGSIKWSLADLKCYGKQKFHTSW